MRWNSRDGLSAERKRRIETLLSWAKTNVMQHSDLDGLARDFWQFHTSTVRDFWRDSDYYGWVEQPMLRYIFEEAQKRWAVSDNTARDYSRIVYRTLEVEVRDEIGRRRRT